MLKTTVLIAGLAASSALDKKECNPANAPKGPADMGTYDCTDAKTHNAKCTLTPKDTPTHVGGGVVCKEQSGSAGSSAGQGCFGYEEFKACKIPTADEWTGWGCTGSVPTATVPTVPATTSATYSCTLDAKHQKFTGSGATKAYTTDATGTVSCTDGEWKFNFDKGGPCLTAPSDPLLDNDPSSTATSTHMWQLHAGAALAQVAEDFTAQTTAGSDDVGAYNPPEDCLNCAGTNFPANGIKSGQKCCTKVRRMITANKGYEGHVTCENGKWVFPKRMCGLPRQTTSSDQYTTKKYVAAYTGTATASEIVIANCGVKKTHKGTYSSNTAFGPFALKVGDAGTGTSSASRERAYMSQTSDDYTCYSPTITISSIVYGGGEITCGSDGAFTLNEAPKQCVSGTSADDGQITVKDAAGASVTMINSYNFAAGFTPTIADRTDGATEAVRVTGDVLNDAKIDQATNDLKTDKTALDCKCAAASSSAAATWACKTVAPCAALSAVTEYTVGGRTISCTTTEGAKNFEGSEVTCDDVEDKKGKITCDGGSWKGLNSEGKSCAVNVTLPDTDAGKTAAQAATGYGFSWSTTKTTAASYSDASTLKSTPATTFAVPTDGRTTCGIDRWAPGFLTCDHNTGKITIQGDYTKCAGAGGEITADQKTGWNYDTLSIGGTPGSTATITCAEGAGGADHLKGTGVCSPDNKGTVTWKPCLRPCTAVNSSQVMDSIKASGAGKNDTTGLEFSGTNCSSTNGMANVSSSSYLYACTNGIKTADHYYGGSVSCNAVTGKYEAEAATKRKCDLGALASGTLAKLCTETEPLRTNGTDFDKICKAHADGLKSDDETVKARWTDFGTSTYDCSVKGTMDKEACNVTIKGDNPPYKSVAATCDTSNAGQADTACISPAADRNTAGCYKITFEENTDGSAASVIGAGIVTLLALFHL